MSVPSHEKMMATHVLRRTPLNPIRLAVGAGRVRMNQTSAVKPGITYSNQSKIPRLPIPDLDTTLNRFLYLAKPIITTEQLADATAAVAEYRNGRGPADQETLKAQDAAGKLGRSYIDNVWAHGYLADRVPITVNTNPYFALVAEPDNTNMNQLERAARFLGASSRWIEAWMNDAIPPDYIGKDTPLDMSQYKLLFGTGRIPHKGIDELKTFYGQRHLCVLCNGNVFKTDVLDENGNALSASTFLAALKDIENAAMLKEGPGVGTLTGLERDRWARLREEMESFSATNRATLKDLDSALMVLSLDQATPAGLDENAREMLHTTTARDRWYDKAVCLIVCKNGEAGINFEHAWGDGHTLMRFVNDMYNDYIHKYPVMEPINEPIAKKPEIAKCEWELPPTINMNTEIAEYKKVYEKLSLKVMEFTGFGKDSIKQLKVSPDAFVQMSYQYAYARLNGGAIPPVYESVMTKKFMAGRTEALRSATPESQAFIKAFMSKDVASAEKARLLRSAVHAHVQNSKLCSEGLGVDRHLLALRVVASEAGETPRLFTTAAYKELCQHTVLSTSTLASNATSTFGFGPVAADGLGMGYRLTDNAIYLCCTSYHHDTAEYVTQLQYCLHEMLSVMHENKDSK